MSSRRTRPAVKPPPPRGAKRAQRSGWITRTARGIRALSWYVKVLGAGMLLAIAYSCFTAVDSTLARPIRARGDVWVCDLKTICDFPLDQVHGRTEDIPRQFRQLDGKRVEITGEMWSPDRAEGALRHFQMVYSIANCCFSGAPKIQHVVDATVPPNVLITFRRGRTRVLGTLHVGVRSDGEGITSVYRMDVERAEAE